MHSFSFFLLTILCTDLSVYLLVYLSIFMCSFVYLDIMSIYIVYNICIIYGCMRVCVCVCVCLSLSLRLLTFCVTTVDGQNIQTLQHALC